MTGSHSRRKGRRPPGTTDGGHGVCLADEEGG